MASNPAETGNRTKASKPVAPVTKGAAGPWAFTSGAFVDNPETPFADFLWSRTSLAYARLPGVQQSLGFSTERRFETSWAGKDVSFLRKLPRPSWWLTEVMWVTSSLSPLGPRSNHY